MTLFQQVLGQFGPRLINTGISALVAILCALLIYFIFRRKFDQQRARAKFRYRISYITITVLLLVLVRIWIEGFTHLFTMLSLVGAGLVIVNKETLMNLAGCLIINWRGFFAEGDFIQIQNLTGCVASINLLYFKVYETTMLGRPKATGHTLKIPNSLVITNPITIFSADTDLELHQVNYVVSSDKVNAILVADDAIKTIKALLDECYKDSAAFSKSLLMKRNKMLSKMMKFEPTVDLKVLPERDHAVMVQTNFYCYAKDAKALEQNLLKQLITSYTVK